MTEQSNTENNKRIAKNTIALYVRMIVLMVLSFFMSRVVLDVLGVEDYGIYNLVGSVVVSFTFLKNALSSAVQRFLNYEMGKQNYGELSKIFCTSVNSFAGLSVIIAIGAEIAWYFFSYKLNIPEVRRPVADYLFHIVVFTTIVSMMQVPFNACIIAYEKMSFYAKISILEVVLKIVLIFGITFISIDKLILYGYILLFNALIILSVYIGFCYRNFEISHYHIFYDSTILKKIFNYTSWSLLGNISGMLSENGVSMVFNVFSGVIINAAIGVAMHVNSAVVQLVGGFQQAFNPQIVKLYAANKMDEFYTLIFRGSKFSYFLLFTLALPIIAFPDIILDTWLVDVPQYAPQFCSIIFACSLVDSISGPFYTTVNATGRIRNYQIAISLSFLLHFVVTYILLKLGLDYTLVFFSRLFTRGLVNFVIGIYFIRNLVKFPVRLYFRDILLKCIEVSIIPVIFVLIVMHYDIVDSFIIFVIIYILTAIISIATIYTLGLSSVEKTQIRNIIAHKIHKH